MLICFHHTDHDGLCAGAIVKNYHEDCEMLPIDYGQQFPLEKIKKDQKVFIVDYSIEPDEMENLLGITSDVIWIDHHKTAIEKYKDFPVPVRGIRDIVKSGCELTWSFIYGATPVPPIVSCIGDRDTWQWKLGELTALVHYGLGVYDLNPSSENWTNFLNSDFDFSPVLNAGRIIRQSRKYSNESYMKNKGFETEFEGHRCFAANKMACGSEAFGERSYAILISYGHDGLQFTVSLYSTSIDVSEIAKKYGGGGHTGAAGFQCKELPFRKT